MKKIIFILALFVSFVANSQYTPPTGYTNINARYDWLAGVFRALGLPAGGNAAFTTGQAQRAGSVYYDSTGADAGLKVWNGAAWVGVGEVTQSALDDTAAAIRGDFPSYTASQGITKTGSDFQLGGLVTEDKTISVDNNNHQFRIRKTVGDYPFAFVSEDTISGGDPFGNKRSVGFVNGRTLKFPSYSTTQYKGGSVLSLEYQIKDSAQMTTIGGDFGFSNKTGTVLSKMAGYSGRSVYMGGSSATIGEGVPIQLNDLTLSGSSTTSNYKYAKNYWIASQSYLVIPTNDTMENWVGFHNKGFVQGKVKWAADYAGGYFSSGADKSWFLYNYGDNSNSYHKAAFYIGDSVLTPSALLNVSSTTKGVIWPRMTTVQKDAIASPATGLIVFDTDLVQYNFWDGDSWEAMGGGGATPTLQQVFNTEVGGSLLTKTDTVDFNSNTMRWLHVNGVLLRQDSAISNIPLLIQMYGNTSNVLKLTKDGTETNTVRNDLMIQRMVQGVGAAGLGAKVTLEAESSTAGSAVEIGSFAARYVNPQHWSIGSTGESEIFMTGFRGVVTADTFMNIQKDLVRINNNADTLATKAYARSVGGGGATNLIDLDDVTVTSVQKGNIIFYDSTSAKYINGYDTDRKRNVYEYWEDFPNTISGTYYNSRTAGAGALVSRANANNYTSTSKRPGVVFLGTGSTSTGYGSIDMLTLGGWPFVFKNGVSYGDVKFETSVQFNNISTALEEYVFYAGINADGRTGQPANSIHFEYDRATYGDFWVLVTTSASSRSVVVTTTAVTEDLWHRLELRLNADATAVTAFINGTEVAASSGTYPIVSNIYDASTTVVTQPQIIFRKTVGTTEYRCFIDYIGLQQTVAGTR